MANKWWHKAALQEHENAINSLGILDKQENGRFVDDFMQSMPNETLERRRSQQRPQTIAKRARKERENKRRRKVEP